MGPNALLAFRATGVSSISGTPTESKLTIDVRDVNGDRIADLIENEQGTVDVSYGSGGSPASSSALDSDNKRTHSTPSIYQKSRFDSNSIHRQTHGFYDFTGDGLLDAIHFDEAPRKYYVSVNLGDSFGTPGEWPVPANKTAVGNFDGVGRTIEQGYTYYYWDGATWQPQAGKMTLVRLSVLDFNGDGQVELVRGAADPDPGQGSLDWEALTTEAQPPQLVKQVQHPAGTTDLTYDLPVQTSTTSPLKRWVLEKRTATDTRTTNQRTNELTVTDPVYDHENKQFRGHKQVRDKEGSLRYVDRTFATGEFDFGHETLREVRKLDAEQTRVKTAFEETAGSAKGSSAPSTGERWRKTVNGAWTLFVGSLLEHHVEGPTTTEYFPLEGVRSALSTAGNKIFFSDALDTAVVVDDNGNIDHKTTYLPYGKKLFLGGTSQNATFDFGNKRRDPTTGTLYMGARYYDPKIRMFLSIDPLRFLGAADTFDNNLLHGYLYGASNPMFFRDIGGLEPIRPATFAESLIPVYGPARDSIHHFQSGNIGRGIVYGLMAGSTSPESAPSRGSGAWVPGRSSVAWRRGQPPCT